jgi:hypothetical protein
VGPGGVSGTVTYQGYGGSAVVSADGATLTVGPYALSCAAQVSVAAKESATQVALFLRYLTPAHPRACPPGSGTQALRPAQVVRLRSPLGHRALVDGTTGKPTPSISGQLVLKPALVPDGYRLTQVRPWFSLGVREPACVQVYQRRGDATELEVVQVAGHPPVIGPRPGAWSPILVRGRAGRAAPDIITWREAGLADYIMVISEGSTLPPTLTTQQLIAIADSAKA